MTVSLVTSLFVPTAIAALSPLDCTKQPSGEITLDASPDMLCSAEEEGYSTLAALSPFLFILFAVLPIGGIVWLLYGSRRDLRSSRRKDGQLPKSWQWELFKVVMVADATCKAVSTSNVDPGYVDAYRGWYDVQGCGQCNDYCRWVGNSGSDDKSNSMTSLIMEPQLLLPFFQLRFEIIDTRILDCQKKQNNKNGYKVE